MEVKLHERDTKGTAGVSSRMCAARSSALARRECKGGRAGEMEISRRFLWVGDSSDYGKLFVQIDIKVTHSTK